jgi:hypothetical protein
MADNELPRDKHPRLKPDADAEQRGTNPAGQDDEHPKNKHADLPPRDPNYQQSDTNQKIDQRLREDKPRRRTQTLFPYLLIRAFPGDRGARQPPLWPPTVCWESCDLHLLPAGGGSFDFGRTVLQPVAGQAYRVFVHAWNLGRFAAYGVRLRAWWVEPGFFNGTSDPRYQPHFIGGAYVDLGDRDSRESHRLVEIQPAWTVVMNNDAHECLMATIECAADPWDGVLDSNSHRHVAQRNLNLVAGATSLAPLVATLGRAMTKRQRQLVITSAAVGRTNFIGANERGLAKSVEAPGGWNNDGIVPGPDNRPVATVRAGVGGWRSYELSARRRLPMARTRLGPGTLIGGSLEKALPDLLQDKLGVPDLNGATVAAALSPGGGASMLRFSATDRSGKSMGYSIIVAP